MNKKLLNERDICTKFITPNLVAAGWNIDTQFRVEQLPSTSDVVVRRDGQTYDRWRVSSEGAVEIQTDVEQHSFEIITGYRSAGGRVPRESGTSVGAHTTLPGAASMRLSSPDVGLTAIRDAGLLLLSGAGTCPCCA